MKVRSLGPDNAEIGVVYCTHGDEVAGKKAVERLLDAEPNFRKGVKFVFANEKAFEQGTRFVDEDLNRSFPGDKNSDIYEERLACRMIDELKDLKVLDLHETSTPPVPFALFSWMDEEIVETVQETGVEKAVEISYTPSCGINHYGGVEVETGPRGTEKSVEMAEKILKGFLINTGALKGKRKFSKPELYSVYSSKKKKGNWRLEVQNFETMDEDEVIGFKEEAEIKAKESFTPVLFAESYPDIFGFKAVRLEKVEERIF